MSKKRNMLSYHALAKLPIIIPCNPPKKSLSKVSPRVQSVLGTQSYRYKMSTNNSNSEKYSELKKLLDEIKEKDRVRMDNFDNRIDALNKRIINLKRQIDVVEEIYLEHFSTNLESQIWASKR